MVTNNYICIKLFLKMNKYIKILRMNPIIRIKHRYVITFCS